MHTPARIGIDDFQANRFRTSDTHDAVWGLFSRQKDGLYDDGRFATLRDVRRQKQPHRVILTV